MAQRVVVDARLLHYNRAGIGRYLRHLYRALADLPSAALPVELQMVVLYARKDAERALRSARSIERRAWTPAHHRLERWALALEIAALRPILLHAPDHVCPQPLGWRTVLTVHDLAFLRYPQTHSPSSRAYYAGVRRSLAQASRVICVSEATRRDAIELAGAEPGKVRVVSEAPDPRYRVDGPSATAWRPYLVFVGTLEPRKNLATLFSALARIPPRDRPALRIAGAPGFGADALMALPSALGIGHDVEFLGRLPTTEVAALYRGAVALVYPSLLEGFGLPILEAMACGTPVITSNCSAMAETAGGAAHLVDPNDSDSVAAAIVELAGDPDRRATLRRAGLERAAQFSWHRAARETLTVFAEALHP
jgi:glycosyltransferase involved in cell wall biosynthesis